MTDEQAKRIIVTSSYTVFGQAMVQLGIISESTYLNDYNTVSNNYAAMLQPKNAKEAIKLATVIKEYKDK